MEKACINYNIIRNLQKVNITFANRKNVLCCNESSSSKHQNTL